MTNIAHPESADKQPAHPSAYGAGGAFGRTGFAWASLEWARNPYYILIVIYIFAPYFAREVVGAEIFANSELADADPDLARRTANAQGQAAIASVTKWAGLVGAFTAPFLGAALDRGGRRNPILAVFLGTMAIMSWLLWYAIPGESGLSTNAIMVFLVIAYVCYTYTEVTHNAMLSVAGRPQSLPMISGLGLGLGNLAATLLFIALIGLFALPGVIGWPFSVPQFGIELERFEHQRIAGPLCAIWIAVFSIPFFSLAEDGGTKGASWTSAFRSGAAAVFKTIKDAARYLQMMKFLIARMLYADAMAALLALGAVYVALFLEWDFLEMTAYAIFASIWAFAGGLCGGWMDTKFGPKVSLIISIIGMVLTLAFQLSITQESLFFGLIENYQVWNGLVFQTLSDLGYLGSISVVAVTATASISSSRSMLVHLAPPGRSGEFFGLYAIAGTVTVWAGPLLVEVFTSLFNSQRIGMASISVLFLLGLAVLSTVKMARSA